MAGRASKQQAKVDAGLALIDTFASGDSAKAAELLAEGYIQHNLASADAPALVANVRSFVDGDYVFLQTVYNFAGAGERVAFDIFRFDGDGKIAERWDNLTPSPSPTPPSAPSTTAPSRPLTPTRPPLL